MEVFHIDDILDMFEKQNLDVRTVTLGLNLSECCNTANPEKFAENIYELIQNKGNHFKEVLEITAEKYGIELANKRLSVTPIGSITNQLLTDKSEQEGIDIMRLIASKIDAARKDLGIDIIGGFSALVHKGMLKSEKYLINSLPFVLSETEALCSSINVATTKHGINMNAIRLISDIIMDVAYKTKDKNSFGAAKLVVYSNIPEDNPYMAGSLHGVGEGECMINAGVSGPGVIYSALKEYMQNNSSFDIGDLYDVIKHTSYKITKTGEFIARKVTDRMNEIHKNQKYKYNFGIVDISLAPTYKENDSVGEIIELLGVGKVGLPGTTAALALMTDAVKKGGAFASKFVGGMSGAFIPVSEDRYMDSAIENGFLTLEKLEAMTSVCSVGIDMVALDFEQIKRDIGSSIIAGIIADEISIGVINNKTTACRLIPVITPVYLKGSKKVVLGLKENSVEVIGGQKYATYNQSELESNLWGQAFPYKFKDHVINEISSKFSTFGGRIPSPINSMKN